MGFAHPVDDADHLFALGDGAAGRVEIDDNARALAAPFTPGLFKALGHRRLDVVAPGEDERLRVARIALDDEFSLVAEDQLLVAGDEQRRRGQHGERRQQHQLRLPGFIH